MVTNSLYSINTSYVTLQCIDRYKSAQIILHSLSQRTDDKSEQVVLNKCL